MRNFPLTFRAVLALSAAGLALAGCSLAPDYIRPTAPVAAQWPEAGASAQGSQRQASATSWQTFFPDTRLQALITSALANNRDMRVAVARVDEARGLAGVARADRWPNVALGIGRTASLTPKGVSATGNEIEVSRYDANLSLLSFELDFWGRVRNLSEAARASYLGTEAARRAFRLSLISDVANAWFAEQELTERLDLARETLRTRKETRDFIALRRQVGLAGDLDYLQADGAFESARADAASLERQRAAAHSALVLLVGAEPKDLPPGGTLRDQGAVVAMGADLAAELPSDVLLRRPDVIAAEQALLAANANIGAARAAFLPKMTLTGAVGSASPALSGLFKAGTGSWAFTPLLSLPLFDGGRNSANVDVAEARKVIAVAQYEKAIQTAFKEVADLLNARRTLAEQLQAQERLQAAQDERFRLTEARYKAGVASHLELLDAQRDSFSAQQSTVQVRRQLLTVAAQLYKALGGGDEAPAADPTAPNAAVPTKPATVNAG